GMSELLNMSTSNYAKIERGEIDMTIKRLQEIAKVFGVEVAEFVADKNYQSFTTQTVAYGMVGNNQGSTINCPPQTDLPSLQKQVEMLDMAVQRLVKRVESLEQKDKKKS
ncbi:MAG: helix-turn-helix domain-containing protein, partial [Thermoflexibacteraceae bacterium]